MKFGHLAVVIVGGLLLNGCANSPASSVGTTGQTSASKGVVMEDNDMPASEPAFAKHFTDPIYNDTGDEFAPFGTDEGFDMLYEWAERRNELGPSTTVADLIEGSDLADVVTSLDVTEKSVIPKPGGQIDAAVITVGAGFTLLRLTGHIDEHGRRQTLKALDILIQRYGSRPELTRQRDDLSSWV